MIIENYVCTYSNLQKQNISHLLLLKRLTDNEIKFLIYFSDKQEKSNVQLSPPFPYFIFGTQVIKYCTQSTRALTSTWLLFEYIHKLCFFIVIEFLFVVTSVKKSLDFMCERNPTIDTDIRNVLKSHAVFSSHVFANLLNFLFLDQIN